MPKYKIEEHTYYQGYKRWTAWIKFKWWPFWNPLFNDIYFFESLDDAKQAIESDKKERSFKTCTKVVNYE